jgi:hypothetical protein
MPDPIRCSADPAQPNTFTCEPIVIGPDPSAPARAGVKPPPTPAAPSPAVTALVNRFVISVQPVHAAPVSMITKETVVQCLSPLASAGLLFLASKSPLLGALGGVKAGFDLRACQAKDEISRQASADEQAAVQACLNDGGIPTGQVGDQLMCNVTAVTP